MFEGFQLLLIFLIKTGHGLLEVLSIFKISAWFGWTMILILSNFRSIFDSLLFTSRSRWWRVSSCPSSPPSIPSRTPRGRPPGTAGSCSSPASRRTNHPIGGRDVKLRGFLLAKIGPTTAAQALCSTNWNRYTESGKQNILPIKLEQHWSLFAEGLALQIKEKTDHKQESLHKPEQGR